MATVQSRPTSDAVLLWGVLAGPFAWAAHLGICYILVTLPCIVEVGNTKPYLYAVTVAAGLVALSSVLAAAWQYGRTRPVPGRELSERRGRGGFMAVAGMLLSGISLAAIIVESFAFPFVSFCE